MAAAAPVPEPTPPLAVAPEAADDGNEPDDSPSGGAPEHPAPRAGSARRRAAVQGSLWIKVRPWAHVFVDGKARGETPIAPFPIGAGKHAVLLVNEQLGLRKTYEVDVRPNQQQELKVVLGE